MFRSHVASICTTIYVSRDVIAVKPNEAFFSFFSKKVYKHRIVQDPTEQNCRAVWHTQIDTLISKNICVVSIIIILISINSGYFSRSLLSVIAMH